jgi:predicted lipoprotein with Yx(FWY)xxD motif
MKTIVACLLAAAVNLIALGAWADAPAKTAEAPALVAGLTSHKTIYGDAIADARGMTLYVSDSDSRGKSSCDSACAETWQPAAAPRIAKPSGDWSVITRDDGTRQWAYHGKPLYSFADDHAPGDVSGDGVDGRWHAAMAARAFIPAEVTIRTTDYGPTFATADGRILYMFVKFFYNAASNGTVRHQASPAPSACVDDCARTWLPLVAPVDAKADGDWSLVARDDGKQQWAWKSHPLYTYTGDTKPGDALGEGNWTLIGNVGTHWEVANIVQ